MIGTTMLPTLGQGKGGSDGEFIYSASTPIPLTLRWTRQVTTSHPTHAQPCPWPSGARIVAAPTSSRPAIRNSSEIWDLTLFKPYPHPGIPNHTKPTHTKPYNTINRKCVPEIYWRPHLCNNKLYVIVWATSHLKIALSCNKFTTVNQLIWGNLS